MTENRKFNDIVQDVELHGYDEGRQCVATCTKCGRQHSATVREWDQTALVDDDELRYVAQMRAWSCCMGARVPEDGLPEDPRV